MDNKNIKVSIIMPVYKVEEYVGKAIESIQAQTLTEVVKSVTNMRQRMIESR